MGDLERTVEIIFQGVDSVSGTLTTMSGKMQKFGTDIGDIADPFHSITKSVIALDAAVLTLAGSTLAISINKFAEYEDVMLKVKGVAGANAEQYERLKDITQELGATTRYTATEAAQGLEFLSLAGLSVNDSIGALPEVLKLAQASAVELGTAADIVTNIMAGYGIEVEKLGNVNDILTATFTNSNTSLEQLGQAFKYVGPVAKSLGFDIEETSAALGVLGNAGYQAEMGGTALRNIMLALVAPAGNMGKLMKELGVDTSELGIDFASSKNALDSLGVTIKDQNGNILPFSNILGQVKEGLEKIQDPADKTATLIEIFGKRGGPQMAAFLEQGVDSVVNLQNKIDSLGGVTDKIAKEMESGIGGSFRAVSSAFESIALEIGDAASKGVKSGADGIVEVLRAISGQIDAGTLKPVFDTITAFGNDLQDYLTKIAAQIPEAFEKVNFDDLMDSVSRVTELFKDVFDGLDLTTADGLAAAIQKMVDGFDSLVNATIGISKVLIEVGELVVDVGNYFADMDKETFELIGTIAAVGTAFTGLAAVVASGGVLIGGLGTAFKLLSQIKNLGAGGQLTIAFSVGWMIGGVLRETFDLDEPIQKAIRAVDKVINFSGQMGEVDLGDFEKDQTINFTANVEKAKQALSDFFSDIDDQEITIKINDNLDDFFNEIDSLEDVIKVEVEAGIDQTSVKEAQTYLDQVFLGEEGRGGYWKTVEIHPQVDLVGFNETKKKIEEVPTEKMLEIKLQGEIDKDIALIEQTAETARDAFKYTAEVEIANAESAAMVLKEAFDSVGESVVTLSDSTASMFDSLINGWGNLGMSDQWHFMDILEDQQDMQRMALESQIKLNDAQVDFMNAKTESFLKGDAAIKIDTTGLEPALELVLWQIIKKAQVRANEESADFLLGIGV